MTQHAHNKRRSLLAACTAHVLHDGYMDLLYVLLPIWQAEFGLGYAALGLLRATYPAAMAAAQVPVDRVTAPFGARASLVGGTLVSAAGFLLAGASHGITLLCVAMVVAGLGASTQHPRSSVIVTDAYAGDFRGALGVYNFAGDVGKAAFPALTSLLLIAMAWRHATLALGAIGVLVAAALVILVPRGRRDSREAPAATNSTKYGFGFAILFVIGVLDTATRMGFLLFLPFILVAKHASEADVGIGLALVFAGGAFGKFVCGWLGQRLGLVGTVVATECLTAALIAVVTALPLEAVFAILPVLGLALNGTSSVLYGTVPDVAKGDDIGGAFALFYTGVIGAAALAPVAYGSLADIVGRQTSVLAAAATALTTIPLVLVLARRLSDNRQESDVASIQRS